MRVLVTGGAGFIGSHLADAFADRGDQVAVVDDLSAGSPERFDERAVLHTCTITDTAALNTVVATEQPDLICHLAAQIDVRTSVTAPARDAQVNIIGTVNVLEAARTAGARILFCSSGGALYGRDNPVPTPETGTPAPESPYGTAKYCAEHYAALYNRLHDTRHAVLRLANVYGPRQDPAGEGGVVGIFCARAHTGQRPVIYGDGTQTRDFIYVTDVVTAFLAAADTPAPGTWNIGTGTQTSINDLAALTGKIAGTSTGPQYAPARPGELPHSALDADQATRDLGWRPQTTVTDGVAAVYHWIQAGTPWRGHP